MAKTKAVFLDRDGVINELVYFQEHGIIDSPFIAEQFKLIPGVAQAIKQIRNLGYKAIIVSNQPGMAKGHMTQTEFEKIRGRMHSELVKNGAFLDGEYYCFHHPEAVNKNLRIDCACRKPKPGLILQAAEEMDIDLSLSWFIGDNVSDIKAGKTAGCRTILIGKMKCEICHLMDEAGIRPDAIKQSLMEAIQTMSN